MRRIHFIAPLALACASLLAGCGQQPAVNTANNSAVSNTNTNTAGSTAAAEAEVRKLMADAAAALSKNDADAMAKIYSDNYMLVNLDGSVETREQRLNALRNGDVKYTSFSYDEPNIRVNPEGTGAIVIARANIKGTMRGKPIDAYYRVTQVYVKMKDGWKQVTAQATAITAAPTSAGEGLPTPAPGNGLPTPPTKPAAGLPTPGATSNANR
jgi:uncharacterized protein (TIGR02246 family)